MASRSLENVLEDTAIAPVTVCGESDDNDRAAVIFEDDSVDIKNTNRLLELLPEEIWTQVLEKLSWSAKEHASNASVLFRNLLSHDRIMFLFPDVWVIYAKYVEVKRESLREAGVSRKKMLELYPTHEVTNLRGVCRHWRNSIDKILERLNYDKVIIQNDNIPFGEHFRLDRDDTLSDILLTDNQFGNWARNNLPQRHCSTYGSRISWFNEIFSECPSDTMSCFGRYVQIETDCYKYHDPPGNCSLLKEISAFLVRYGQHIRYLSLADDMLNGDTLVRHLQQFNSWLALVPNLIQLRWEYRAVRNVTPDMIESITFPTLSQLKVICFKYVPSVIGEKFLEQNSNLEVFQPYLDDPHLENITITSLKATLPNLTQLTIIIQSVEDFDQLENLQDTWKLRKLELVFKKDISVEWRRIFKVLESWKETLKILALDLPRPRTLNEALEILNNNETRVDLPHVCRLRFRFFSLLLIKYFLRLKALEVLEIGNHRLYWGSERLSHHQTYFPIEDSMVWKIFPKLRRINLWNIWSAHSFQSFFRRNVVESKLNELPEIASL